MKAQQRLSIIIPCYRSEKFISKCIDSIYRIPLPISDFEVLCFDDKSSDSTPLILDEYAAKYSNIQVVHSMENIGPGGGRNHLLSIAQGRYVWFVDSDDLVVPESVEPIIEIAEKNELDVLTFNYRELDCDGNELLGAIGLQTSSVGAGRLLANQIFGGGILNHMGYPWRFLLRRDYLLETPVLFPEKMTFGEDTVWMAKVVLYAEKMCAISDVGYIYWHHEESICGTMNKLYPGKTIFEKTMLVPAQLLDLSKDLDERYENTHEEIWKKHSLAIEDYSRAHYVNNLPIMLCRSSWCERAVFYKLLFSYQRRKDVQLQANLLTKLLMVPCVGPSLSFCISIVYKILH